MVVFAVEFLFKALLFSTWNNADNAICLRQIISPLWFAKITKANTLKWNQTICDWRISAPVDVQRKLRGFWRSSFDITFSEKSYDSSHGKKTHRNETEETGIPRKKRTQVQCQHRLKEMHRCISQQYKTLSVILHLMNRKKRTRHFWSWHGQVCQQRLAETAGNLKDVNVFPALSMATFISSQAKHEQQHCKSRFMNGSEITLLSREGVWKTLQDLARNKVVCSLAWHLMGSSTLVSLLHGLKWIYMVCSLSANF